MATRKRGIKPPLPPRTSSTSSVRNKTTAVLVTHPLTIDTRHHGELDASAMATSFLPFCAHCEKQIMVPNQSILYCSESCRRRDLQNQTGSANPSRSSSAVSLTSLRTASSSPPSHPSPFLSQVEVPSGPPPVMVPPASPTHYPGSMPISIGTKTSPHITHYSTSPTSSTYHPTRTPSRPVLHARTNSAYFSSHSTVSSYYDSTRPLPPLHHPSSSPYSSSFPRSIDLVTPIMPLTSKMMGSDAAAREEGWAGGTSYGKKREGKGGKAGKRGEIGKMFNFEAMRG